MTAGLSAQAPTLRPLSEYLQEEQDPTRGRRYAANRCGALFSLISTQRAIRGDAGTAEMYSDWVIGFGAVALGAVVEPGLTSRDALGQNQEAFDRIKEILTERMDRNMALSGSYYADDPLLGNDFRTCRDLVDQFRL